MDCQRCIFREDMVAFTTYPDGQGSGVYQTGCAASRLQRLKERGKAKLDMGCPYYRLEQFCNMYRDTDWPHADKPVLEAVKIAQDETEPLFGLVIRDDENLSLEMLDRAAESVAKANWPKKKLRAIISTMRHDEMPKLAHIINRIQKEYKLDIRAVLHMPGTQQTKDFDVFSKLAQATYFVTMSSKDILPTDIFQKVNKSLNHDLEFITVFDNKNQSIAIVRASMMKRLYYNFLNYYVAEKELRAMAIEQGLYRVLDETK